MLVSLLLLGLSCCAPQTDPSLDGLAAVRGVLKKTDGSSLARDDYLVRRLASLGPGAAPTLFALVSGEALEALLGDEPEDQWLCPLDRIGTLALDALGELAQVPLRDYLQRTCAEDPAPLRRVAAWSVLGRQASAEGIPLWFELCAASPEGLEHRSLRDPARSALASIVRSDGTSVARLQAPLLGASVSIQALACEALAESRRPEALGTLSKLLGKDRELDLVLLRSLASVGERAPWVASDRVAPRLRTALEKGTAPLRAAAAEGLGRIKDGQSVPDLIACLADPDEPLVRAARWALKEITGETRLTTQADWQAWLEGEHAWWRDEGQRRLDALARPEAGLASSLRALLAHPLGRDRVSDALSQALASYEPASKRLACETLARISAKRAVPALVELLFDPDAEVRAAAWAALRALTGENLPAEPRLWEEYAFG